MAINLTNEDHNAMDGFLEFVLEAYKDGRVTKLNAVGALAHVLTAAAKDNDGEVMAWFRKEQYERWEQECIRDA